MIDQNTLLLGGSLLTLVIVNILLGSVSSLFQKQFEKVKFFQGICKGLIIVLCFILVLIVGKLNANIVIVNINNQAVDLATATNMLMLSSYAWYGKEVYIKMTSFLNGNYKITEVSKTEEVKVVETKETEQ